MASPDDRTELLQARLLWLDNALVGLQRDEERTPYFALSLLLIPVAGYLKGGLAALLVAITSVGLVSVAWYIVWGHKHEYSTEKVGILRELKRRGIAVEGDGPTEA